MSCNCQLHLEFQSKFVNLFLCSVLEELECQICQIWIKNFSSFLSTGRMSKLHPRAGHHRLLQPARLRHQQLQPEVQNLLNDDDDDDDIGRQGQLDQVRQDGEEC